MIPHGLFSLGSRVRLPVVKRRPWMRQSLVEMILGRYDR